MILCRFWFFLTLLCLARATPSEARWSLLSDLVESGIQQQFFPGAAVALLSQNKTLFQKEFGNIAFDTPSDKVGSDTVYDLDTFTYLLLTQQAVLLLSEEGHLPLESKIDTYLHFKHSNSLNIFNLLTLTSRWQTPAFDNPKFPCLQNKQPSPQLVFDNECRRNILHSILNTTSLKDAKMNLYEADISTLILSYIVGKVVSEKKLTDAGLLRPECLDKDNMIDPINYQCFYEAYVRDQFVNPLKLKATFLPPRSNLSIYPPTANETNWRHRLLRGEPIQKSSFLLGGISGYAGLFGSIHDLTMLTNNYFYDNLRLQQKLYQNISVEFFGWEVHDVCSHIHGASSRHILGHLTLSGSLICFDQHSSTTIILLTNGNYLNFHNGPNHKANPPEYRTFLKRFTRLSKQLLYEYNLPQVDSSLGFNTFLVALLFSILVIAFLIIYRIVLYVKGRSEQGHLDLKKDIKSPFDQTDEEILELSIQEDDTATHKFNSYLHNSRSSSSELKQRVVQVGIGSDDEWSGDKSD